MHIMRIVETIAQDKGISADFASLTPLAWQLRHTVKDAVVFLPGTGFFVKHWPLDHWLMLKRRIENERKRVVLVGDPQESPHTAALIEAGIEWIKTPSLLDAIDVVSSALAVVAVDTGLMHAAVHQGRPTVGLFNRAGVYRRHEPHCRSLVAPTCTT